MNTKDCQLIKSINNSITEMSKMTPSNPANVKAKIINHATMIKALKLLDKAFTHWWYDEYLNAQSLADQAEQLLEDTKE